MKLGLFLPARWRSPLIEARVQKPGHFDISTIWGYNFLVARPYLYVYYGSGVNSVFLCMSSAWWILILME